MATIQRERFVAINKQNGGNNGGNGGDDVGKNVGDVMVTELTERQHKLMGMIKAYPTVSVAQMAVMMSVKKRTVERELAVLRKKGIIAREGGPRTGRWIVK